MNVLGRTDTQKGNPVTTGTRVIAIHPHFIAASLVLSVISLPEMR